MSRPRSTSTRKRGAARKGKLRENAATGRYVQATLYYDTMMVVYYDAEGRRTGRRVPTDVNADEFFDDIEEALDEMVLTRKGRTIHDLGERYLLWLEKNGREDSYLRNVRSILNAWINPLMGHAQVLEWDAELTLEVAHAAATGYERADGSWHSGVGGAQQETIRTVLAGMRDLARMRSKGGRWLPRSVDPLEGVSFKRGSSGVQGEHARYVPPSARPTRSQVETAIEAARRRDSSLGSLLALMVTIAAYFGLRVGEQLGLRAIDVDLRERHILITGAITRGGGTRTNPGSPFRKCVKNRKIRTVAFWRSLEEPLRQACCRALGLDPATHDSVAVARVIDAERARRQALADTGKAADYRGHRAASWWQIVMPFTEECWLFPQPGFAKPWTHEALSKEWRGIRDAAADLAADDSASDHGWTEWPTAIP